MHCETDHATGLFIRRRKARKAWKARKAQKGKVEVKPESKDRVVLATTRNGEEEVERGLGLRKLLGGEIRKTLSTAKGGVKDRVTLAVTEAGKRTRSAVETLIEAPSEETMAQLSGLSDEELEEVEGVLDEYAQGLDDMELAGMEDTDEAGSLLFALALGATPKGRLKQIQGMQSLIERLEEDPEKNERKIERIKKRIARVVKRLRRQVERRESRGKEIPEEVTEFLEDYEEEDELSGFLHSLGRGSWGNLGIDASTNYLSQNPWVDEQPVGTRGGRIVIGYSGSVPEE